MSPRESRPKPRRQCKTCPWKEGGSCARIPGYRREKHEALDDTIATPGYPAGLRGGPLRIMACHYSTDEKPISCVGWVANQLGPGNNLALRLRAMRDPEFANVRTVGPQRRRFEDTFASDGDIE